MESEKLNLSRRTLLGGALGLTATALLPPPAHADDASVKPETRPSHVIFRKTVINADSDFEVACAADIDGDGKLDIVSGDTWYHAPDWQPHKFREIGVWGRDANNSGYRKDFADLPVDVNGDGKIDIVSSDMAAGEVFWHENVGNTTDLWPRHVIAKPGGAETSVFAPFIKGVPCVLPNVGSQVVWYELRKTGAQPEWVEHKVGKEGAGHGIGYGDVNNDGKIDIITPHGWYEQVDARADKWVWHPDWECNPGDLGIGTPCYDVDGDGRNDIIFGSGHHYGVFWLQQMPPGSPQKWVQRPIDTTFSQAHSLILADLEHNHKPVVLTGKRYKAHDHDIGANEPLGLYYYKYDRKAKNWVKYVIDENTHTGAGLQLTAVDLRRKGRLDIIAPGKSGLYLFENDG